jgi:type IV pilus modification protein PilV
MIYFNKIKFLKKNLSGKPCGFTIMEVLIAMAIFAIGVLGVATMQISSTNGNTSARKSSEASEMGQEQIESLMTLPYVNVVDGNIVNASGYTIQWTVLNQTDIDGDGNSDFMTIQVIVNDPQGRLRSSFSFTKTADI